MCNGSFQGRLTRAAYFMSLRAEGEIGSTEPWRVPPLRETDSSPAPWAGWFDRRPRTTWLGFIHSLVFYGLLKGLRIHYETLANGESTYGVEREGDHCWLGSENWLANGKAGRELAGTLWRSFLAAGGPRPTDFMLRASPDHEIAADHRYGFLRKGPVCWQRWEIIEPFERSVRI